MDIFKFFAKDLSDQSNEGDKPKRLFFLSGFSFTNIHNLQDNMGGGRLSL